MLRVLNDRSWENLFQRGEPRGWPEASGLIRHCTTLSGAASDTNKHAKKKSFGEFKSRLGLSLSPQRTTTTHIKHQSNNHTLQQFESRRKCRHQAQLNKETSSTCSMPTTMASCPRKSLECTLYTHTFFCHFDFVQRRRVLRGRRAPGQPSIQMYCVFSPDSGYNLFH